MEKIEEMMGKILFPDEWSFSKVLWRLSSGSRSEAIKVARKVLKHYDFHKGLTDDEFGEIFDCVCADVNDGFEVEWLTE